MSGPRYGRAGLREKVGQPVRPLLCGVLKPVGLCVTDLAKLAYSYALGGLDIIKDDQGLANQAFCPFEERVRRCVGAVEKANQQTGRNALYLPIRSLRGEGLTESFVYSQTSLDSIPLDPCFLS